MVYRIRIGDDPLTAVFEGLLDGEALEGVLAYCETSKLERLILCSGTEVASECVRPLARLQMEVKAESPYLAHWLRRAR